MTSMTLAQKDAAVAMASAWIIGTARTVGHESHGPRNLKAACSRQVDRYRPPHGRAMVSQPRRCVFGAPPIGEYLPGWTGNRRWPQSKVGGQS